MKLSALFVALSMCVLIIAATSDDCRCIFLAGTSQGQKLGALNYVCANLDCSPIQQGGADYYPDTIESHASWAIDAWFQAHRDSPGTSCDFSGTAEIICEDCTCVLETNATIPQLKVCLVFRGTNSQSAIAFVCGNYNCTPIYPGGDHYEPNTPQNHAAWAVNTW